ncbi:N-acyl-D-amino-acid deacylase family protein [Clostridium pasteurianum]|uniref:N-acyl-D-aspartate/D-glutamate deacylase n=1 Tax=Clostridium pasteurianum BC1 TaxID=86416 RepID=R4K9N3_CLOPA|nr:amidohydrolase family protein [Clostridium pasteurianum]AGK97239.1 N-acyl-D-aspartate/D-glutamate deacylase [Clostridium pasteurianum BC1]
MNIYDLVISNGNIVDVEQKRIIKGNIGICKNKICKITDKNIQGKIEIDAKGLIVSPGFIDIHGHIDGSIPCGKLAVLQGVTTAVGGNCGGGILDIEKFFDEQDARGFFINQAQLVGHSFRLREAVGITNPYIAATKQQIEKMSDLLKKSFQAGAIGLSFGIEYAPGSSKDEIMILSKIAEKYGKFIAIHTNVNNPNDLSSLEDAIKISEITGAKVLVSHFVYQYGTGIMTEALEMMDKARHRGLEVSADSGMYSAFSTFIGSTIYDEQYMKKFGWKFDDLLVATGKYKGKRLTRETYEELRRYSKEDSVICFTGIEDEIYEALAKEYVILSSDIGPSPTGRISEGHPQNAGTFPRFFRKMVREKKVLSLIEAIEKCTLFPAERLGLTNKGRMKIGADADIVIFDIDTIRDKAQFPDIGEPDAKPEGVHFVVVNGKIVVNNGELILNSMPGKSIRDLPACTIW